MLFNKKLRFIWTTCETNLNSVKKLFCKRLCSAQVNLKDPTILKKIIQKKKKINRIEAGGYILLLIPVTAFGLGTWQIQRKMEKNQKIKLLKDRTTRKPVNIPTDLNLLNEMEYCPVSVKGRFDYSREIFVGPRPVIKSNNSISSESSLISFSKGGFLILTPFKLSDRDLTILVNRGWVPREQKLQKNLMKNQVSDEVEIVGLIRHTEKRRPLGVKNNSQKGTWIYKDIEELSKLTGTAPVLIDELETTSRPEGPIKNQYKVKLPDDHINYIITWYALCGITSYLWYMKYIKKV